MITFRIVTVGIVMLRVVARSLCSTLCYAIASSCIGAAEDYKELRIVPIGCLVYFGVHASSKGGCWVEETQTRKTWPR